MKMESIQNSKENLYPCMSEGSGIRLLGQLTTLSGHRAGADTSLHSLNLRLCATKGEIQCLNY